MNFVIWVADSMRADHLETWGYGRQTSPHLESLADDGVRFMQAYAPATWTRPSAASLFTGLYPAAHGARCFEHRLRRDVPRIPDLLGGLGFATGVFSAIGMVSSATGFGRGVDHFVEMWNEEPYASDPQLVQHIRSGDVWRSAEAWISQQIQEEVPFFALLWTIDTHVPFEKSRVLEHFPGVVVCDGDFSIETTKGIWAASRPEHLEAILAAHDAAIIETDEVIGRMRAFLKRQGVYEDTLVLVVSDHGEVFNEHGRGEHTHLQGLFELLNRVPGMRAPIRRYRLVNEYGWLGHLDVLPYDEVLRIPLIVKFPGQRRQGQSVPEPVQIVDIAPTLLDVCGNAEFSCYMQGTSMLPLVRGEAHCTDRYLFSDSQSRLQRVRYISVQHGKWKLVRALAPTARTAWWRQLSSVAAWQQRLVRNEVLLNTSDEGVDWKRLRPEIYARLEGALDVWWTESESLAGEEISVREEDEALLEKRLADLGYL